MNAAYKDSVQLGINHFCQRHNLPEATDLRLLTGGANMELWAFDANGAPMVLRRFRNGVQPEGKELGLSMEVEAQVLSAAQAAGIKAPDVIDVLQASDELGPGYVMSRMDGEALPNRLFRDPKYSAAIETITPELGRELAKVHAVEIDRNLLDVKSAETLLQNTEEVYKSANYESPVVATALRWLRENLPPADTASCLLHGDFRMGNLLIEERGLSAVLDWELAHFGSPEKDIAWFCMPSWRFGRYDKTAGGVGKIDDLVAAYESVSPRKIDRQALTWYLVFSSLSWGSMAIRMAYWWRKGDDRSLERILIGTRVSEVEIDLLLMLEDIAGVQESTAVDISIPNSGPVGGDVSAAELIEAAVEYLSNDVVPAALGAEKFQARIAANDLSIANRIITLGPHYQSRAQQRLQAIGLTDGEFIEHLNTGTLDWRKASVLSHLRLNCLERLSMHQPKYAAIEVAKNKWQGG